MDLAKNLPFAVDNLRLPILPRIAIPNLGSHILLLVRRQLPDDRTGFYNVAPVLIKTFVETLPPCRHTLQGVRLDTHRNHPRTGPI